MVTIKGSSAWSEGAFCKYAIENKSYILHERVSHLNR
jgi:hypothetical protein